MHCFQIVSSVLVSVVLFNYFYKSSVNKCYSSGGFQLLFRIENFENNSSFWVKFRNISVVGSLLGSEDWFVTFNICYETVLFGKNNDYLCCFTL